MLIPSDMWIYYLFHVCSYKHAPDGKFAPSFVIVLFIAPLSSKPETKGAKDTTTRQFFKSLLFRSQNVP